MAVRQRSAQKDPVGYPDFTLPVSIIAQIIETLKVDIAAQTLANLKIDIVAQTLSQLDVNIAASAVTLSVSIDAQTVDVNIKTSGGANIVIDKLTQGAYTERRTVLENYGPVDAWGYAIGNTREGKFFPRGARGMIDDVKLYCRNTDTVPRWIKVFLSPFPGAGVIMSFTITLDAGYGPGWYAYSLKRMWNYDSIFIWYQTENTLVQVAESFTEPYDSYTSIDAGLTWTVNAKRNSVSVTMAGLTCGDIPVSGTLNTILIPTTSDVRLYYVQDVTTTETTMKEVLGMGVVKWLEFDIEAGVDSHHTIMRVYCDDNKAFEKRFSTLNYDGFGATTPGISLTYYGENTRCHLSLLLEFSFRHSLKLTMQTTTETLTGIVEGLVNLIK